GRYWEAGASQVHWLVCTNEQLKEGIDIALSRVQSAGVFIEGTSFLQHISPDFTIMVVNPERNEIKGSAVRMIDKMKAIYVSGSHTGSAMAGVIQERLQKRNRQMPDVPIYDESDLPRLIMDINCIHQNNLTVSTEQVFAV